MNQEDYNLYVVATGLFQATMSGQMRDKQELSQIPNKSLDARNLSKRQELEKSIAKRNIKIKQYSKAIDDILVKYFPNQDETSKAD